MFDSTQAKDPLPEEATITGIRLRLDAAVEQAVNDRRIVLLLFVGDLAAPRAKIRLADLLRQGARPVNLLRLAGQPVQRIPDDPNAPR